MGVALSTVIDRLYRDFLTPPDEQPAQTTLAAALTTTDGTTVTLTDDILTQEEEDSIGSGSIIEADRELMRVTQCVFPTLTVVRGVLGTTAATHLIGATVILRPKYPRQGVFDAVCDTIEELNSDLYTVATSAAFTTTDTLIEVPATVQRIIAFYYRNSQYDTTTTRYVQGGVELLEDQPTTVSSTGKAIQLHDVPTSRSGYYIYRKAFTRPAAETYDLTTDAPNFPDEWNPLLMLGSLINLMAGTDIPTRTQEFITEGMETQGYPVGAGESISKALVRIFEYRLGKAKKALDRRYPMIVLRNQVSWA